MHKRMYNLQEQTTKTHTFSLSNPGTNLVITVTFASFFYPLRAQCFVMSQEVAYIFWGIEASTEMAPSKM